jgi:lipopolysaccharide/colanic/teichoic acid biosynthesis glycosyltransferase
MPVWQQVTKRAIDITASLLVLVLGSPFFLLVALITKFTSRGPILFFQERIGKDGAPFNIIKFRSMYVNAEKAGPALSSQHDPRITPWGRFMRKTRIDEFPQFYNVLIGEMSLVGPRPERQFFIDKIMEKAPHYRHLTRVKPGITSLGQVKYGYAENVDQMVKRLKFDILYIENMSLGMDFRILIHTVLTVLGAKGK